MRADNMAAYLEAVQWKVRPAVIVHAPELGPPLPVSLEYFSPEEVAAVLKSLRNDSSGFG